MLRAVSSVAVAALLGAWAAGCATHQHLTPKDQLLKRAAYDFDCTKDELEVTKLDDETRGVQGCGHRATYVRSCSRTGPYGMNKTDCTWVMNNARNSRDDDE
jgi:hypothetical protein